MKWSSDHPSFPITICFPSFFSACKTAARQIFERVNPQLNDVLSHSLFGIRTVSAFNIWCNAHLSDISLHLACFRPLKQLAFSKWRQFPEIFGASASTTDSCFLIHWLRKQPQVSENV
jgi:hypothetical protein